MAGPVQVGTPVDTFGGNNVTPTLTGVTAGNLLIVTCFGARLGVTSSPPAPAGWIKALNATWVTANFAGYDSGAEIYYQENATAGAASCSLDCVESNAALRAVMSEWAYPGTGRLDKISTASAATPGGTSGNTGTTATTSQANELIIAIITCANVLQSAAQGLTDPPTGFTSLDVSQTSFTTGCGEAAYKEVTATGTQTAAYTWSVAGEWLGGIATFKLGGGGGTAITGTGTLTASKAVVAGSGKRGHPGTGALTATKATTAGSGKRGHRGSGALSVTKATVSGSGGSTIAITGSGALTAADSNVVGSGHRGAQQVPGAIALTASKALVSGSGIVVPAGQHVGSGALTVSHPLVAGSGKRGIHGSGALLASKSLVSGIGFASKHVTGTGALTVNRAFIRGFGPGTSGGVIGPGVVGSGVVGSGVVGSGVAG